MIFSDVKQNNKSNIQITECLLLSFYIFISQALWSYVFSRQHQITFQYLTMTSEKWYISHLQERKKHLRLWWCHWIVQIIFTSFQNWYLCSYHILTFDHHSAIFSRQHIWNILLSIPITSYIVLTWMHRQYIPTPTQLQLTQTLNKTFPIVKHHLIWKVILDKLCTNLLNL